MWVKSRLSLHTVGPCLFVNLPASIETPRRFAVGRGIVPGHPFVDRAILNRAFNRRRHTTTTGRTRQANKSLHDRCAKRWSVLDALKVPCRYPTTCRDMVAQLVSLLLCGSFC